jgi:hypothetical protein
MNAAEELKHAKPNAEKHAENATQRNSMRRAYLRTVPRFIMGLTTAVNFGATALVAVGLKNLWLIAWAGEKRFSMFMCRQPLSKSAKSFSSLALGAPDVISRAPSCTRVLRSRVTFFCGAILRM